MSTATAIRPRTTAQSTPSPCGPRLWACRCHAGTPRTQADVDALHMASVQRALLAGWDTPELRLWVLSVVGR